eukprot:scaffold34111_cov112-Isochrysis_galbana.AAC.4
MSHWSSVPLGAPDPILGLVEAFKLDPSPDKVRPPLTRRSPPFGACCWPDARLSGQGLVSVAPSPTVVRRVRRARFCRAPARRGPVVGAGPVALPGVAVRVGLRLGLKLG